MKRGDLVRHNEHEGLLRVKKCNGAVVVCEDLEKPKHLNIHGTEVYPIVICEKANLKLENEPTLFT